MHFGLEADAARDMLLELPVAPKTEIVGLHDALRRVLAQELSAAMMSPPFDKSPYDGFAFRGEDTLSATTSDPAVLSITGEIPAGTAPTFEITKGCAAKILTGAPIPMGANATIMYEKTEFSDKEVKIFEPARPDTDIIHAGDYLSRGETVAKAGTVITAPLLGVMASQGIANAEVYERPKIAILNTGSELVEVGNPLTPAKIYNSNVYTLCGYITEMGAIPVNAGVADDAIAAIAEKISAALESADMVITTGGASVGDYDYAVQSAEAMGARVLFWKTAMKPGGAMMAAVKDGKVILGLSGNPGSAIVGLLRIALPYIRKLCGRCDILPPVIDVFLKYPLNKKSPRLRLLRGRLEIEDGRAYFAQNNAKENGNEKSLVDCDLLGEIPAGSPPLLAGTRIKAYCIRI